ncbi:hypothetical protein B0H11DRAFT_2248533 [Mycena galericulata]|nr:hypothetical protein B0H11DRAFT_2248533 [Mycena galericulata]
MLGLALVQRELKLDSNIFMSPSAQENTLAGIYAGGYIAAILYGLTTLQAFIYLTSARTSKDPLILRALVGALWILDTVDSVGIGASIFRIIVVDPTEGTVLSGSTYWGVSLSTGIETVMETVIRGFYCHRIWKLSHGNILATGVASAMTVIAAGNVQLLVVLGPDAITSQAVLTYGFGATYVLADVILALTLVILLWRMNPAQVVKSTSNLVHSLVVYIVTTGVLTSLVAICVLVVYETTAGLAYAGVRMLGGKMYFNAMLGTLTLRPTMHAKMRQTVEEPPTGLGFGTSIRFASSTQTHFEHSGTNADVELGQVLEVSKHGSGSLSEPKPGAFVELNASAVDSGEQKPE